MGNVVVFQKMIEEQNLEGAIQYYHEDCIVSGPGENDVIKGHQELMAVWKQSAEILPKLQWDEPFMDGTTVVRRGHLDTWKFECRLKMEDNKVKEVVTTTIA